MDEHINGRLYDHSMSNKISGGGWWTIESENRYSSTVKHTSYFVGGYNGSKTLPDWGVIIRQAKFVRLSTGNIGDYRIDFGVMDGHISRGSHKTAEEVVPSITKSVRNTVPPVSENHAMIGFVQFEFKYEWQTFRAWYEISLENQQRCVYKQATPQQSVLLNRKTKMKSHILDEISPSQSELIERTDGLFEKTSYGRSPNEERKEQMKNLPNAVTRTQFGQVRFIRIGPAATRLSGDSLAANIVPGYDTPVIDIMEDSLFQRDKDTIRLVKGRYIVEGPLEFNTMMLTEMSGSMTRMTKAVGSGSNVKTSKFKQQSSALRRI